MSKPKLNIERMESELSQSAFFRDARQAKNEAEEHIPQPFDVRVQGSPVEKVIPPVTPIDASSGRSVGPNLRRQTVRRAFEFYMDQLESIEKLSIEDRLQGGEGNKSQMVREALDAYIGKKRGKSTK